ncbi:Cytochrome c-type biogenesis protein CcsA/ResC [[Actinomadura] parvosata subsp. kistnae]|uniref:C-type cytochrome biogenesis protein CcsB n=1 Tax=[Actinomadura] parvosata subsp. kistnae TaxID=1909395 RepID=A0A1V0AAW7_9ACTN|nr:cytochrome c biogenesis protein CcsA [Nonomuraea sp. ATCC 55076]AQZ67345.1 c-type cytochrome biogenesis protein CcsB [Nonomuraea sp. ATCC 55076]SPL94422.1 Cytochrome c-type biogenesis protein CcsA/ResC [Actinomadura parvosata subsp. kistnae]
MSAEQLAELSDLFVVAAVLLYVVAMVGFAIELAFGRARPGKAGAAERAEVKQPVTVGAASSGEDAGTVSEAPVAASADAPVPAPPGGAVKAGTVALVLAWLGWAANLGAIVTRGLAVDRWPWGNMYEFVVAICFAAVTAFLGTQLRHNVRFLGGFVMVTAALGLGLAVKVFYTTAGPVVPALNSYWIAIHVTAAIISSGLLTLAGVSGVLYLVRGDGMSRLPSRADLEKVAHRAIVFAFPLWTFAVIAGALWADRAWGRYWGWDPKEVWSFITWVAYAAYLHAKVTAGWRGKAATIVQLVAFGCLLFNLIGVNIFISGLHSYADVP